MGRPKTKKPKQFKTYKRKPGAFDRFTCSQVNPDQSKVLNQAPLSNRIEPEPLTRSEFEKQVKTAKHLESIGAWMDQLAKDYL